MDILRERYNKGEPLTDLEICVLNYGTDKDAEQLAALLDAGLLAYQTLWEYNLGDHRAAITLRAALNLDTKEPK